MYVVWGFDVGAWTQQFSVHLIFSSEIFSLVLTYLLISDGNVGIAMIATW